MYVLLFNKSNSVYISLFGLKKTFEIVKTKVRATYDIMSFIKNDLAKLYHL